MARRTAPLLSAALLLAAAWVSPAAAQAGERQWRAVTDGGANVFARVPASWRPGDPLVVVNHGYSLDFDDSPSLGPLVDLQLAQGFAVAASGFRTRGWGAYTALEDNARLLEGFAAQFGSPGAIFAVGGSMGGLVSLRMGEDWRFRGRIAGVYALCPPADGARAWDSGFNLRMAYDATCAGVGGGELLTGDPPLEWAMNLADVPENVEFDSRSDPAVRTAARITQCTGVTLPPFLRTAPQRNRLATIQALSGITDEDFLLLNLGYATFGLSELVRAPDKAAGLSPFDNRWTNYASALPPAEAAASSIDARVRRVTADRFARLRLLEVSNAQGFGNAPVISLHTSGDELVAPWHQRQLRLRYRGAPVPFGAPGFDTPGLVSAIVVEAQRSHCAFTRAELETGWNALRQWAADGRRPSVAELRQRCLASGAAAADCRIDPAASADAALPPVPAPLVARPPGTSVSRSGIWFDPARSGEGFVIEELDRTLEPAENAFPQRVILSWYTYAPGAAGGGAQRWFSGLGLAQGDGFVVDELIEVSGGRFLSNAPVRRARFGRVEVVFEEPAGNTDPLAVTARLRYAGAPAYGAGELALRRLVSSRDGLSSAAREAGAASDPRAGAAGGIYAFEGVDGQGFVLHEQVRAGVTTRFLGVFGFDAAGAPLWLSAADGVRVGERIVFDPVLATRGARFDAFDPAAVQRIPWGRIELELRDCAVVGFAWRANDPALGEGRTVVRRAVPVAEGAAITGCTAP
jgi:hypothetical protein